MDDDIPTAPDLAATSSEPYEPPRIDVLGTVDKLTTRPGPVLEAISIGLVISF